MNAPLPSRATSPVNQPALPDAWIARIFQKLEGRYGSLFLDRWRGCDMANVRETWAEELAGFADKPECISYALQSLADQQFPPTLPEFLAACRRAPIAVKQPALPFKADSEKAHAMAGKLAQALTGKAEDPLFWARHPKTQIAMDFVIDGAKKSEALRVILAEHRRNGVCNDAGKLLIRYKGQGQWEAL